MNNKSQYTVNFLPPVGSKVRFVSENGIDITWPEKLYENPEVEIIAHYKVSNTSHLKVAVFVYDHCNNGKFVHQAMGYMFEPIETEEDLLIKKIMEDFGDEWDFEPDDEEFLRALYKKGILTVPNA